MTPKNRSHKKKTMAPAAPARTAQAGKKWPAKSMASAIAVHCHFDAIVPSGDLKFYPGNYKKHPAKQLDRFETVVHGNGWRRAIVVSKLSGLVTKGNGAGAMALRRGWDVPVEYQEYKSKAEELRDLVADNALSELAVTDDDALRKLLEQLDSADIALAGVTAEEFEKLLAEAGVPEGEFEITAKLHESYDYVVIATDNSSDFVFLQTLCGVTAERSYKKTGVGLGRVIPFKRFLKSIYENRDSINVQGSDHDDAQAHPKRGRVRARKPSR